MLEAISLWYHCKSQNALLFCASLKIIEATKLSTYNMTELFNEETVLYNYTRSKESFLFFLAKSHALLKDDNLRFNISSYGVLLSAWNNKQNTWIVSDFYHSLMSGFVTKMYPVFLFVGFFVFANGYGELEPFLKFELDIIIINN